MGTLSVAFVPTLCSNALVGKHSFAQNRKPRGSFAQRNGRLPVVKRRSLASISSFRMCARTEEKSAVDDTSNTETPEQPSYVAIERYVTIAAYAGFLIFTFFLAPGSYDTGEVQKLLSGNFSEMNDLFFAIFNLTGVQALNLAAMLNPGASQQKKLPTTIFSVVGIVFGFLALGPYMTGREYATRVGREQVEERGLLSRILESRIFGVNVLLYALWIYGFAFGLFTPGSEQLHDAMFYAAGVDLGRLFVSDRFVFSTTVDTMILSTLMWGPLTEDMRRRGWFRKGQETESWLTSFSILLAPGLGPALYLVLRPRLPSGVSRSNGGE